MIDHDNREAARKMLVKYHLEGEKPTRFFCSIMKKGKKSAQFNAVVKMITDEDGEITEEVLDKQEDLEDKVCRFYKGSIHS